MPGRFRSPSAASTPVTSSPTNSGASGGILPATHPPIQTEIRPSPR